MDLLTAKHWHLSHRADPPARALADRHYSRQKVGTNQFVPPGRCLVLRTSHPCSAVWVTSWPFPQYVQHHWAGAWTCSLFRREESCPARASDLIKEAVAVTLWNWPIPPSLGMVTFIDRQKVKPTMVHGKPVWGWTYCKAGFLEAGETRGGLLCLQLLPEQMPEPLCPKW